jgi:hypothetical protein
MNDLGKLVEAAKRGSVEDVRAMVMAEPYLVEERDASGATALHYAAFGGHNDVARILVEHGAYINARDGKFQATPADWAIEYLREMGGFLGVELTDFAHAIRKGNAEWTGRFLKRFPALRDAGDLDGTPFRTLALQCGNSEIVLMFKA